MITITHCGVLPQPRGGGGLAPGKEASLPKEAPPPLLLEALLLPPLPPPPLWLPPLPPSRLWLWLPSWLWPLPPLPPAFFCGQPPRQRRSCYVF